MTNVIHLRPKTHKTEPDLDAIDKALGPVFCELAEQHGTFAVTTVAMKYVLEAIIKARERHRPVEDAWLRLLSRQFKRALRGKP